MGIHQTRQHRDIGDSLGFASPSQPYDAPRSVPVDATGRQHRVGVKRDIARDEALYSRSQASSWMVDWRPPRFSGGAKRTDNYDCA